MKPLSPSHFLIDFYQNWHRRKNPQSKNEFVGVNIAPPHPFPNFALKASILRQEVLKIHANINSPISTLNVRESPKFPRLVGNRGRGTRWWRQILDRK